MLFKCRWLNLLSERPLLKRSVQEAAVGHADDSIEVVELRHVVFPSDAVAESSSVSESLTSSPLYGT